MSESTRTKRALADALKQLMASQKLSKITVRGICETCGMSRKGFYYHFKDKYDLVNWIFDAEFSTPAAGKHYESGWMFFRDLCTYFYENRRFYINAFEVDGQNSFADHFGEVLQPVARTYFEKTFGGGKDHEFYATFFTDALRVSIIRWLREDAQIAPDRFVQLMFEAAQALSEHLAAKHAESAD